MNENNSPNRIDSKLYNWLTVRNLSLALLIAVLGYLNFQLFAPYLNILIISFIIVELTHPLYEFLNRKLKKGSIAAIISTIISFLLVTTPVVLIILVTVGEAVNFSQQTQQFVVENEIIQKFPERLTESVNGILQTLDVPEEYWIESVNLNSFFLDLGSRLTDIAGSAASGILTGGFGLLFQAFLLIVSMIYIYQLRSSLKDRIKTISPFDDGIDEMFYDKFISTSRVVIKGTVLVALAQATAVSIIMLIIGIGAPVLLWIIMVLASIIPIGSGIVWLPTGLVLIATGQPLQGLILIIYSTVIINVIDTSLRPQIMKGATHMHPLVTLFSILGGISMFGMIGILYGPLLTVFFISLLHVYRTRANNNISVELLNEA